MRVKRRIIAVLLCCLSINVVAQECLHVKVVDAATNQPVAGASIRVDQSLIKSRTNNRGESSLSNLATGVHKLSISHVSYQPKTVVIDRIKSDIIVRMDESYINVAQVVVTGTGTHHRMTDSPVPVSVITAKDISNAGVSTLDEALQKLSPSFSTMTNGMGTTLSMNGLPDNYFIFLLNGIRMINDETYARINVNDIKRIEILNGASSTLYGTNAIGGVINIITNESRNSINVASNSRISSKGRFSQSVNADVAKGKIGSYTSYQHQQADNWQLSPYEEVKDVLKETNKIASTGFHSDNISQRFTFDANDRLSFYLNGGYYRNKTDRPYDVYAYDMLWETYNYGAGGKFLINRNAYLTADYMADYFVSTYSYYKDDTKNKIAAGDELVRKRARTHDANVKGIFNLGSANKVSVGMEYMFDVLKSNTDNIDKESAYTLASFLQDEVKITPHLQALLGLRYLYHETFNSYLTENISLMYKWAGLNLRGTFSTGFRAPTLSEIYATDIAKTTDRMTIGNMNLKPEKNNYFSFNAEYNHSRFAVSANVFYNKIRDMIDYNTIATGADALAQYGHKEVRQRDNIKNAKILGLNISANGYVGAGLTLNAGYSYLHTKDVEADAPIDKSIKNTTIIGAKWLHSWKKYQLNVNINGRINSRRYSKTYGYAPSYQMWDINTRHSFHLRSFTLEPGIGVENVFDYTDDRPYNSNYATLSPGRSLYASLAIKFNK